jgi:uncharacterized repeat protein (TIGR03803 family)
MQFSITNKLDHDVRISWKRASILFSLWLAAAIGLRAQEMVTFETLVNFDETNGDHPYAALVQGTDGNFYGTTYGYEGGSTCGNLGCGTVFRVTPEGSLTTLYSFCSETNCVDGSKPYAGLVLGTDGSFYGTTVLGGTSAACSGGCGTVFRIAPGAGTPTTLHSFNLTDGAAPNGTLVQATDGNFYGTTAAGGTSNACNTSAAIGCGTVFKITPQGGLTSLFSFDLTDGAYPAAGLVQGTDGDFYGTTAVGGNTVACSFDTPKGCGTVFKITSSGVFTILHSFDLTDGAEALGALIQATNGAFYGTTTLGGTGNNRICAAYGCGTVFKITAGGALTSLHTFNWTDGSFPKSALLQATSGLFYGTTYDGGTGSGCLGYGCGTVFSMTAGGTLDTLITFDGTDGANPTSALTESTSGTLYGTTNGGGTGTECSCGTVFSLAVGLGAFVETLPASGKVGAAVKVLGTNLTGASSVTFNGTSATFTVKSGSVITTTVPAGATTGAVEVVTPSGTLSSNVPFRVD